MADRELRGFWGKAVDNVLSKGLREVEEKAAGMVLPDKIG
jgi:hypothetical protein